MDSVGFTDDEQENVFSIIASILHLGNITFTVQEDESVTVTEKTEALLMAARFLEVDSEDLKESLCYTFIQTKREKLRRNYTKEMAEGKSILYLDIFRLRHNLLINQKKYNI
uniref:Myosin motor domain-containing protein n=1 Tax=Biomphalaria glabrata TaxID=6526 RepID=A0A2C9M5E9_BIOGL